jgi:hypothetical protein
MTTPRSPVVFSSARDARETLVGKWGMDPERFEYAHQQVLDAGYCPFWLGKVNYCLTITKNRSEWRLVDVTAPETEIKDPK